MGLSELPAEAGRTYPAAKPGVLRVEVIDKETGYDAIRTPWLDLAQVVDDATCFCYPAVFNAWRRCLAGDVDPLVLAVYDGERLCAIMPMMRARVWRGPSCVPRIDYAPSDRRLSPGGLRFVPVRQLSSVVSWSATLLRPTLLCRPEDLDAVTAALSTGLASFRSVDAIVLPVREGPEAQAWQDGFRGAGLRPWLHRLNRTVLTIENVRPFAAIVADQNRNFRRNIRRADKAAEAMGLSFSVREGKRTVLEQVDLIAEIARASWKHAGSSDRGISIPYDGPQRHFFETLLNSSEPELIPVLFTAEHAGKTIAVQLCLQHHRTLTGLLMFRDESADEASPGLLLLGRLIDWAAERGIRRVDLNATQDWVRHLADSRHVLANVVVFTRGLRGAAFGLLSSIARRRHERSDH